MQFGTARRSGATAGKQKLQTSCNFYSTQNLYSQIIFLTSRKNYLYFNMDQDKTKNIRKSSKCSRNYKHHIINKLGLKTFGNFVGNLYIYNVNWRRMVSHEREKNRKQLSSL